MNAGIPSDAISIIMTGMIDLHLARDWAFIEFIGKAMRWHI